MPTPRSESIQPRTALVTGANRGIGLEVCRQLALQGFRVVMGSRDAARGERARVTLPEKAASAVTVVELDVSSAESIQGATRDVHERFGGIDVLVNNAAVLIGEADDVLDVPAGDLRTTFDTNFFGAVAVAQAFVPGMVERHYGRVVNVSSTAGQLSTMGEYAPAYSMSKAALNAFTVQLAAATRGSGVLVNSACPGWVRTDMGGRGAPRSVEEGADTIVWLATLPQAGPSGQFFRNRKLIAW